MSEQQEHQPKFNSHVEVTSEFVSHYFKSAKGQCLFANLLQGLNAVATIKQNLDCPEKPTLLIEADSKQNSEQAKMKVMQALFALTSRGQSFTHLVTIPFTEPTFVANYLRFKETVLSTFAQCSGINESLFQNAKKLHLTVSVLTLVSDEHIAKAKDIIQQECRSIIDSGIDLNKNIEVKGLAIMNNDPYRTNVLYANVPDERLQVVADRVARQMLSNGLVFKDDHSGQSVKLHITLMNTVFSRRKAFKSRKGTLEKINPVKSFDSGAILEHFQNHVFAEIAFPCVQLNDVRAQNEQGYYKIVHSGEWIKTDPNNDQ